jgi:hypothetical protein
MWLRLPPLVLLTVPPVPDILTPLFQHNPKKPYEKKQRKQASLE